MTKKFNHPLMFNNISRSDRYVVANFIKNNKIFTQSKKVIEFEKKWSRWLGVKYSTFVNSGSSANFISVALLKEINENKKRNEIIVPTLTWVSDINSILINGFKPVFVDIGLKNLSMDIDHVISKINSKTLAVFITHAQGFNGLNTKLLRKLREKKIFLLEDVCESHGAKFKNKKLGNYGIISNFSFYYAHHLSTIEGGMICTNNKYIDELAKMYRSHGMVRESQNKSYEKKMIRKYKDLSPKFIFMYPTLNFRNNEIGAVIGINQLKRLDKNNKLRNRNFKLFLKYLDKKNYFKDYDLNGCSNYAFPIILKTNNLQIRNKFENYLLKNKIEFRRGNAGGGNQLRQPYLKKFLNKEINFKSYKNVEKVHFFGYYIGNYPTLNTKKVITIAETLNRFSFF